MKKKWHLHEHQRDILDWFGDVNHDDYFAPTKEIEEQLRFLAYERWLNDRELLTIEDEYEWRYAVNEKMTDRSPSPNRPTTIWYSSVAVERKEEAEAFYRKSRMERAWGMLT